MTHQKIAQHITQNIKICALASMLLATPTNAMEPAYTMTPNKPIELLSTKSLETIERCILDQVHEGVDFTQPIDESSPLSTLFYLQSTFAQICHSKYFSVFIQKLRAKFYKDFDFSMQRIDEYQPYSKTLVKVNNNSLAFISNSSSIKIWDFYAGQCLYTLTEPGRKLGHFVKLNDTLFAFTSSDGRVKDSVADNNTIKIWNLNTNEYLQNLEGHTFWISTLVKFDHELLASGSNDQTIKIWNFNTGQCLQTLKGHDHTITSIIKLDDNHLAAKSIYDSLKVWNYNTAQCQQVIIPDHQSSSKNDFIKLNDDFIAFVAEDSKTIKILNFNTGEYVQPLEGHQKSVTVLLKLNHNLLASGSTDGSIKIWDLNTHEYLQTLEGHTSQITSLVQLDVNHFASGSFDGTTKIWNLNTGVCLQTNKRHQDAVEVLLKLDDNLLASGSLDGTIKILDLGLDLSPLQIVLIAHLQKVARNKETIQLHDDWKSMLPERWAERFAHILV